MTIQCCDCKRIRVDGAWTTPSTDIAGPVSHSYCPVCAEMFKSGAFSEKASHASVSGIRFAKEVVAKAMASA